MAWGWQCRGGVASGSHQGRIRVAWSGCGLAGRSGKGGGKRDDYGTLRGDTVCGRARVDQAATRRRVHHGTRACMSISLIGIPIYVQTFRVPTFVIRLRVSCFSTAHRATTPEAEADAHRPDPHPVPLPEPLVCVLRKTRKACRLKTKKCHTVIDTKPIVPERTHMLSHVVAERESAC